MDVNIDDTPFKPHSVADSAFGSLQLLNEIEQWGGTGTFACSSTHSSWLWELLTKNVPPIHWHASIQDNLIASAHTIADPNGKCEIISQELSLGTFQEIP